MPSSALAASGISSCASSPDSVASSPTWNSPPSLREQESPPFSAPYSPQQNGVVERRNQTILGMARSLLKAKNMPARYWGEAVTTAVFLLNRAPTKSLANITPYEAWHGKKPAVGYCAVQCWPMSGRRPHLPSSRLHKRWFSPDRPASQKRTRC